LKNFKYLKAKSMLTDLVSSVNSFLWGPYFLIALLCGTGLYFTIRLRFVQIFKFKAGLCGLFGNFSLHGEAAGKSGMSSFQAVATAVAAQVGTGNLGRRYGRAYNGRSGRDILDVVRGVFRHGDEFCRDLPRANLPCQG